MIRLAEEAQMNRSAARQRMTINNGLRAGLGASACVATIALTPISAQALTSGVSRPVLKPAAAFDRAASLVGGGAEVHLSGPVDCPVGDTVAIRATVSQLSTGAVAEGDWSKACTGTALHWHITAIVDDGAHLRPGSADGVGLAVIRDRGVPVSALSWISPLTLR
jgi:hypothetical protein